MNLLTHIQFVSQKWAIAMPFLLMCLDVVTGLVYAWSSNTFQSSRMREGLGKKCAEMAYIIIGVAVTVAMQIPEYVLIGIVAYIGFMELLSILENCDKLGAPVPGFVRKALNNIDDSLKNDDLSEIKHKLDQVEKELKGGE